MYYNRKNTDDSVYVYHIRSVKFWGGIRIDNSEIALNVVSSSIEFSDRFIEHCVVYSSSTCDCNAFSNVRIIKN